MYKRQPQHPATHGVLRFRVSLEGEIIKKLDVHCGYIHRGIEKTVSYTHLASRSRAEPTSSGFS